MKTKLLGVVVGCVLALMLVPARANTYSMKFRAVDFIDSSGLPTAPSDPVSGTFVYAADAPGGPIAFFYSVSLTIANHPYSLSEVGYITIGGNFAEIGGVLNGVNTISGNTNDFWLDYRSDSLEPLNLYYGAGFGPVWSSWKFPTFTVTEIATPLPAALPLFATGLGALGLLGWRRKRKQAAA